MNGRPYHSRIQMPTIPGYRCGRKYGMRRIGVGERRARLGRRHHLAAPAADPVAAARGVVALHAPDRATVFLSVRARTGGATVASVERALYDDRTLLRMLGMRRTMFVVPVELAPLVQAGCTNAIAEQQRRRYTQLMVSAGAGDGAFLAEVADAAARALAARGEATGAELSADEPRLRTPVLLAAGKAYEARPNITTWVLLLLAAEGRIVRGRPRGSWTSTQWRWSPAQAWPPGGMPEPPRAQARAEVVRRWVAA